MDGLNGTTEMSRERISELEDRAIESSQSEQQREKLSNNNTRCKGAVAQHQKSVTSSQWRTLQGKERATVNGILFVNPPSRNNPCDGQTHKQTTVYWYRT